MPWSRLSGPDGSRSIAIDDFFLEPGHTPQREHPLAQGELIVAIDLPAAPIAGRSIYLKFRDRQSYEFALVSIAAALDRARRDHHRRARSRSAGSRQNPGAPDKQNPA